MRWEIYVNELATFSHELDELWMANVLQHRTNSHRTILLHISVINQKLIPATWLCKLSAASASSELMMKWRKPWMFIRFQEKKKRW